MAKRKMNPPEDGLYTEPKEVIAYGHMIAKRYRNKTIWIYQINGECLYFASSKIGFNNCVIIGKAGIHTSSFFEYEIAHPERKPMVWYDKKDGRNIVYIDTVSSRLSCA